MTGGWKRNRLAEWLRTITVTAVVVIAVGLVVSYGLEAIFEALR